MPSNEGSLFHNTYETEVLVVGGGPVGMLAAYRLAQLGQSSMLVEQNTHTTIHAKMEFISARTMEIYRRMGIADSLRAIGVPEKYSFNETYTTGMGKKEGLLQTLERPSPEVLRAKYRASNDGSHPQEPYMRMTQILFEAWLKPQVQAEARIDDRWGWTFKTLVEHGDHVVATVTDEWGKAITIKAKYVLGCDGAGSKVRVAAGLEANRRSLPVTFLTLHFRSHDPRISSQGQFWHANFLSGAVIVSQDEDSTYTAHKMVPQGTDIDAVDARTTLNEILGGFDKSCEFAIEEILVKGSWKCDLAVANSFRSVAGRVFLAGDSAHQLSPAGGHGLNSGVGDVIDLTWKVAACLKGFGGEGLLASYDAERRPVSLKNSTVVEKALTEFFLPLMMYAGSVGTDAIQAATPEGNAVRAKLSEMIALGYWLHAQEGMWIDYRYSDTNIVVREVGEKEPEHNLLWYVPSTYPGNRTPHVYLKDGTSVFDYYGPDYTVVDFTSGGEASLLIEIVAKAIGVPVQRVLLKGEKHCRRIWGRDVVLLRPDGHVCWRAPEAGVESLSIGEVRRVWDIVRGYTEPKGLSQGTGLQTKVDEVLEA